MLAEAKYSLVYRNHLEMRVSEPLCDRQAHVMSVRADLGAMLLIVGRTASAIAAGSATHIQTAQPSLSDQTLRRYCQEGLN